jgi:hypothetical protein
LDGTSHPDAVSIGVTESKMTVRTIYFVTAASPDFLFPSRTWLKTINLEDFAYGR